MGGGDQTSMIGRTLGHYRLVAKVGAGGMGEVYRARDERLERDVAVKVLPAGTMADDVARRRFRKEALALSSLNHPNIQTVHDFDTQEGVDFLATEFVEGVTLTERLARGPLPVEEAVHLGVQLAAGLAAAHEHRVVHRDLKPSNLRVTPDGRLKILDFGLARQLQSASVPVATEGSTRSASEALALPGTLPYMAPEVLRGAIADERSDIYSAGVTLYVMATGQRPFQNRVALALMEAIVHSPTPPPRRLRADLPPVLEAIILRCLEKRPEDRYQSARDLQLDLQQLEPSGSDAVTRGIAPTRRRWRPSTVGLAALTLLAAVLATRVEMPRARGPDGAPAVPITSLAVLPLEDLSHDPEQAYFAGGLTEALTTDLGRIHALRVISRTSATQYESAKGPVPEIGKALGVDGLVEGSVLRLGNRVRVTVRLIHAGSDTQMWARTFERDVRDVFNLQRELALAIADEIQTTVTPREQARLSSSRPLNPAALEAYLRGNHLSSGTSEQRQRARQYYEEAIAIDPDYAPGYAGLADSYWSALDLPPREAIAQAKSYAMRAVELDDSLAHAHKALASIIFYGEWDWAAAEREFRRALDLNPNDAEAHRMFSVYLSAMDRPQEALAEIRIAADLNPLSLSTKVSEGWAHYYARRYDAAIEQCRAMVEVEPSSAAGHACLGAAYLAKGMHAQGLEECREGATLSGGDPVRNVDVGRAYALLGRNGEARETLDALRHRSRGRYVPRYFHAVLLAALGERDDAFARLDEAYAERDLYLAWLKVDPALDPLRPDPRFSDLLGRMGLAS